MSNTTVTKILKKQEITDIDFDVRIKIEEPEITNEAYYVEIYRLSKLTKISSIMIILEYLAQIILYGKGGKPDGSQ